MVKTPTNHGMHSDADLSVIDESAVIEAVPLSRRIPSDSNVAVINNYLRDKVGIAAKPPPREV